MFYENYTTKQLAKKLDKIYTHTRYVKPKTEDVTFKDILKQIEKESKC